MPVSSIDGRSRLCGRTRSPGLRTAELSAIRGPRRWLSSSRMVAGRSSPQEASTVGTQSPSGLSEELVLLRRAKDRIDREFAEPLDVASIARGVGMSAGHFSRRFRDAYGESPYSYLMTRRIERAMVLLRRGDQSVTAVCFAVGFSSLGTFSTRFSELVGVSPSVYRDRDASWASGIAPCVAKRVTRPVRNREARD